MSSPYKTFTIQSFGCKVNFADSSIISKKLIEYGLSYVKENEIADIYIINTCSVTENADKKANKLIRSINQIAPLSKIVVTGCYAQLAPKEIKDIPGVDIVIGMEDKFNVEKYIQIDDWPILTTNINKVNHFNMSYSLNERTRSFIKIQDGCDYSCTYCTIPNARGKSRSASIKNTINKINMIVSKGFKEIVLCGINVGDFSNNDKDLHDLLLEIEKIKELKRYRISSIEPNLITDKIINTISMSKKALPHFHIPLQSGSDRVLKDMKRRYKVSYYVDLINKINNKIPNVCIGVDVIVGFPTESFDDFLETYSLIENLEISYLHVFSYSKRNNTEAIKYKSIVDKNEKKYRRKLLQKLSYDKFKKHIENNMNKIHNVLFETYEDGYSKGLTENYIKVSVKTSSKYKNKIKKVILTNNKDHILGKMYG